GKSGAEVADAEDLRITGDLTMAIWVRKTAEADEWACIFGKGAGGERSYAIWAEPRSGRWMYQQYGAVVDVLSEKTVEVGRWTHLAVTIEQNLVKVYHNGALEAQKSRPGAPSVGNGPLGFGFAIDHSGLIGAVDDARLYRRALDAGEVRALAELRK
ncbi:MAG: LamG domain-containing protein, partial [Planctomycetota bacterium]